MEQSHRVVWRERGMAGVEGFDPGRPSEGQVLVRSRLTLISPGTERAFFLGLPNTGGAFPKYPGYNCVGTVIARGENAAGMEVGQRVVCPAQHGSHAVMDASRCVAVPEGVSDRQAVFFNMGAIAMQGVRRARIELGESVLVLGAGLVGLLAMRLAGLNGGAPVTVVDRVEDRLGWARRMGADETVAGDDRLGEVIRSRHAEGEPQVVIEATGHPEAVVSAFDLAAPGGRVVLLGSTRGETERVNFYRDVHKKGLTVIGAHNAARPRQESSPGRWTQNADARTVLRLMEMGRMKVEELITHVYRWEQGAEAYDLLVQEDPRVLGIVLDWQGN